MRNLFGAAAILLLAIATFFFYAPQTPDNTPPDSPPTDYMQKLNGPAEQFYLQRSYPDPTFDIAAYEQAMKEDYAQKIDQLEAFLAGPQNLLAVPSSMHISTFIFLFQ